jgi:hypothetical protein
MEERIDFNRHYASILGMVDIEVLEGRGRYFPDVKSSDLAKICAYAEANAVRLTTLAILPARVAFFAAKAAELDLVAAQRLHHFNYSLPLRSVTDQIIQAELSGLNAVSEGLRQNAPPQPSVMINQAHWLEHMAVQRKDSYIDEGTDALYASIIVMAYTLFETLSEDLWIEAVNLRPDSLARHMLPSEKEKGQQSSIALSRLAKFKFDLRDHMGTLLKEDKDNLVSFDSLRVVEKAYHDAFWNPESEDKRKCNALLAIFDKYRDDLRMLEELRNLFVHRGGAVDSKFLENTKDCSGSLQMPEIGTKLVLNGPAIARYAGASLNFSKDLLSFVDGWLCTYKD